MATAREEVEALLHEVTEVRPGYDLGPKVVALAKAVRILADTVLGPSMPAEPEPDAGESAGLFR